VELHGGTVQAQSSGEGMGSTFTVQLPVGAAPGAAGARPSAVRHGPGEPPSQEATDLAQVRVLVVDDEPDARDVVAQILRHSGAVVETAACVRDALAAVSRARPDVIVSDVAMPDQDGYDLIRILREMSDGQAGMIPTLALTAYAREEDRIRCLSAGFQAHVAKPVDPAELCAVVAHLAPERSASAELKCG
jgi:CheY-like chemotaxis protein